MSKRNVDPWILTTVAIVLAVSVLAAGGCAYLNLFYNAEHAFEEAEAMSEGVDPRDLPTTSQRSQYQRAIRKAKLLLEEYPESDLVDDALFLIGKSHLRLEEWSDAIRNLDNLLVNFPNSVRVEEAMYLKGRAHFGRGEEQVGLDWFARLREAYPEGRFGAEAVFRLGDAYANDRNFEQAISYYTQFLERYPKHDEHQRVKLLLARVLHDAGRSAEAVVQLEDFRPSGVTDTEAFAAQRLMVEALIESDQALVAADEVTELSELATSDEERSEAGLLEGRVLLELGRVEEGVAALKSLAKSQVNTPVASEAWGTLLEFLIRIEGPDGERLAEELEAVKEIRLGGNWGVKIQTRRLQLETYETKRAIVAETDSTDVIDRAQASLDLAELALFQFERPDDAADWYSALLEIDPDGALAPRAAYGLGYVLDDRLGDSAAADSMFALVQERYPDSPQARALAGEEFTAPKPRTQEELELLIASRQAGGGVVGSTGASNGRADDLRFDSQRSLRFGGPGAFTPREAGGR